MRDIDSYVNRLTAMRDRLRRQIEEEIEEARDAIRKPGENVNLHTHNADMDVEGLDEAVAVGHAFEQRLAEVERMLVRLRRDGQAMLNDDRERERFDSYLEDEAFAERLRDGDSPDLRR